MTLDLDFWPSYLSMAVLSIIVAHALASFLKPASERILRRWLLRRTVPGRPSLILKSLALAPEAESARVWIALVRHEPTSSFRRYLLNLRIVGISDYAFQDGIIISPGHYLEIGVFGGPVSWVARWELSDGTGWMSRGRIERGTEPLVAAVPPGRTFGV